MPYIQEGGLHHPAVPAITPGPPIQTTDQICGSPGSNLFIFHGNALFIVVHKAYTKQSSMATCVDVCVFVYPVHLPW